MESTAQPFLYTDAVAGARPDIMLLLTCARFQLVGRAAEQIRTVLRQELDGPAVVQLALKHGVMPLVYRSLQRLGPDVVSQTLLNEFQHCFHAHTQLTLLRAGTLLKILRLLEEHAIPALPFKGPVLATAMYENLLLRQFSDLDILIRKADVRRATALLQAQGYHWWEQRPRTFFPRSRRVYEFLSANGQVLIDLHWALTSWTFYFPLDPRDVLERSTQVTLLGTPVRTLAPEDLLLFLCVHGAKHHWQRLAWICDVAAVLRTCSINWGRLLEQASRLGGRRMLGLGVWLAQTLLGTVLPADVQQRLYADPALPSLAAEVATWLFADTFGLLAAVDHPRFYLRLRERWRDRLPCIGYLGYRTLTSCLVGCLAAARSSIRGSRRTRDIPNDP